MIDIAALRVMVAAGMSASAIVDVIEADRKADADAAADKREAARQRQIKHRATKKLSEINDSVTNVTVTARDTRDSDFALSSLLPSPLTSTDSLLSKKEEVLESGRARSKPDAKSRKGTRLPPGWAPNEADWMTAIELLGRESATAELAKFRDWWAAKAGAGGVKLDWDATWRNWIRRAVEQRGANGTSGQARGGAAAGPRKSPGESFLTAMGNVLAKRPDSRLYRGDPGGRSEGPNGRPDDREEPLTLDLDASSYREAGR